MDITSAAPLIQQELDRILATVDLFRFMKRLEVLISVRGGAVININQRPDGSAFFEIADPFASYNFQSIQDDSALLEVPTRVSFTINKGGGVLVNVIYTAGQKQTYVTIDGSIATGRLLQEIEQRYNLKTGTEQYDFTQIPVFFFYNQEKVRYYGNILSQFVPDMAHVRALQAHMNALISNFYYELQMNKTRSYLNLNTTQIEKAKADPMYLLRLAQAPVTLLNENTKDNALQGTLPKTGEVYPANPQFQGYVEAIRGILALALKAVHLSEGSETGTVNSALEAEYANSPDKEVIVERKNFRILQLKSLLAQAILVQNPTLTPIPFATLVSLIDIEIKENLGIDRASRGEQMNVLLNMGMISRVKAYQYIHDVSADEAAEQLAIIDAEQSALRMREMQVPGNEDNSSPSNVAR